MQVLLKGDFDTAHLDGDNSKILPTDTMKNTVYSIARTSNATAMEDYAKELADFLLGRNPQVSSAAIRVESTLWKRLTVDGKPHPSAFMRGSDELQTTSVERAQDGAFTSSRALTISSYSRPQTPASKATSRTHSQPCQRPKTASSAQPSAQSGTTPQPTTSMACAKPSARQCSARFANHDSKSVQQTLYAMAESALEAVAAIDEIEITMPNKHCLLVDLSRFGQDNPNEIFVPTDEPHGYIEARVRRKP